MTKPVFTKKSSKYSKYFSLCAFLIVRPVHLPYQHFALYGYKQTFSFSSKYWFFTEQSHPADVPFEVHLNGKKQQLPSTKRPWKMSFVDVVSDTPPELLSFRNKTRQLPLNSSIVESLPCSDPPAANLIFRKCWN